MNSNTCKTLVRKRAAVNARMTHIKKYIDSLQDTVDMHDVNVRLQLLEKVWKEYNTVQDQLEYNDDDETQQHELDRKVVFRRPPVFSFFWGTNYRDSRFLQFSPVLPFK
jgi:DNA repair ATPase RecN